MHEVDTRAISRERFAAEWVRTSRPIVLRGLVSDWPACRWDLARLDEHWPKRAVRLRGSSPDGLVELRFEMAPEEIARRLSDGVQAASPEPDWFFDVRADFPELLPALPLPSILRGCPSCAIYMGRDTATGAHYHAEHAMICQVHGDKRVLLHPPADSPHLRPHPLTRPQFRLSQIDLRARTTEDFLGSRQLVRSRLTSRPATRCSFRCTGGTPCTAWEGRFPSRGCGRHACASVASRTPGCAISSGSRSGASSPGS